ncbi:MAG: ribonuclease H-like domain-containing protein [bacterium]
MSLFNRLAEVKGRPGPEKAPATEKISFSNGRGREEKTPFGAFYLIEGEQPGDIAFPVARDVRRNLRLLYGIGPVKEAGLQEKGYADLRALSRHARWADKAKRALEHIEQEDIRILRRLGARDEEILPYYRPGEIVFLDIETTGLWASLPLFLVGLLMRRDGKLVYKQLLARRPDEEKALLAYLMDELSHYSLLVTFNGRKFDVPYIEGRAVEHRLFYRCPLEQIDLLYHARRHYRGVLPDCRLVTLEEHLLGLRRKDDVPGSQIPERYFRFTRTQEAALLEDILQHNVLDLASMARLFYLVQETL